MNIAGLQKTTLVDYPGKIAATVFTRGCTFRCGFCHNPELVIQDQFNPLMDESEVFDFFDKRKNQLEAVCITGGEPTMQKDLADFIEKLKKLGYKIKLDTNGTNSKMLEQLIKSDSLDYIAMDIKVPLHKYEVVTNLKSQKSKIKTKENIKKSIYLIMQSGIDYEFRTTVCHPFHTVEDFEEIGKLIKDAKRYYIQNFVPSKHINSEMKFSPFSDRELIKAKTIIKKYIKKTEIR